MSKDEAIVLKGEHAVTSGEGSGLKATLPALAAAVAEASVRGLDEECIPGNTRWSVQAGPLTVCIVELEPALRRLLWIDEGAGRVRLGSEATYGVRSLATPYVVLKVPFLRGRMVPRAELFYRNAPLRHASDELYWPNLLNVSPHAHDCNAWLCTQFVGDAPRGVYAGLDALVTHLWGGGFNRSSELHEGQSAFGKAKADGIDCRVTDVDRWQKESVKNPWFVLDVAWKPVGVTVRQLIEREIEALQLTPRFATVQEWTTLLLNCAGGSRRRRLVDLFPF